LLIRMGDKTLRRSGTADVNLVRGKLRFVGGCLSMFKITPGLLPYHKC